MSLKPALVARSQHDLETLQTAIDANGFGLEEVKAAVRNLVSKVPAYLPKPGEQPQIRIDGCLSTLIDEDLARSVSFGGAMIAGARYRFSPHSEALRYFLRCRD
ncbi:hypothetical protein [Mesorhizobium sp.]|uniref:hypothetical protein n=1 Tax=Mesorhizobium sp. TaxID=1871066 RepID=UPI000FE3114E|nr:hypothetical protein [Mesorhizobium sp.]RWH72810.1 MAG: hypothetical protein EOQ84_11305 [Mesorhizobium sp.]RWL34304.1 MAG: hypothetical protein EOR58_00700 [Mesorhizobium sp.]RWL65317.1 MAG: hypothetical protein EOR64_07715 [Mesorhizobium sp.]RWL69734.1 MAG: hypothetical protein EOR65_18350 [Mesorhizobium sp.]RWL79245.1 MAG: hypothetical protein EOR66_02010 [Mesorhizobium sp.]